MTWLPADTSIVLSGALCALACSVPGTLLVLRKMSMMGDAISHTVLPGLAAAFLVTQTRAPLPMFLGAAAIGLVTALLVQWVRDLSRTDGGTAMGIVFTALFALGLVLLRLPAIEHVDLDPSCVLYGAVETAAIDPTTVFGVEMPRAALINGIMFAVNLAVLLLCFKEFRISAFDPALATTVGINATLMHYILMTMTAVTTVAAFETVGSILVIAMLIVPPAAAYLLTDRFGVMFILAGVIGAASAAGGHIAAIVVPEWLGVGDTVTSGMMAVAAGAFFTLAWLGSPRHGVISRLILRWRLSLRVMREDILGIAYRAQEQEGPATLPPVAATDAIARLRRLRPIIARFALTLLRRRGLVRGPLEQLALTDRGRAEAARLVRSHRLWETYFSHQFPTLPADHLHAPAEVLEHLTDDAMRDRLGERTSEPSVDPHGRAIPGASSGES